MALTCPDANEGDLSNADLRAGDDAMDERALAPLALDFSGTTLAS